MRFKCTRWVEILKGRLEKVGVWKIPRRNSKLGFGKEKERRRKPRIGLSSNKVDTEQNRLSK